MDSIEGLASQMDHLLSTTLARPCEFAHYILVISAIKQTWESARIRNQPMTTYGMSMICCFGGSSVVNLLCGNPMLAPFTNTMSLLLASLVWWLVFYFPMDLFGSVTKWLPVNLVILIMKEIIRTRKIQKGLALSRPVYPTSFILTSLLGMLGACGGGFIKNGSLVLASQWNSDSIKTFTFSTVTKTCLLFSVLYNLQMEGHLNLSIKVIALLQATCLSAIMVSSKFGIALNPYSAVESIVCALFVDYSAFSSSTTVSETPAPSISAKKPKTKITETKEPKSPKQKKKD